MGGILCAPAAFSLARASNVSAGSGAVALHRALNDQRVPAKASVSTAVVGERTAEETQHQYGKKGTEQLEESALSPLERFGMSLSRGIEYATIAVGSKLGWFAQ